MPRRAQLDATSVLNLLKYRGVLERSGLEVVPIDGCSERETAEILQKSTFFLNLCAQEGLGCPPREAMACGCVVIGYDGFGGREYFWDDCTYRVPQGDVRAFAHAAERAIAQWRWEPCRTTEMGRRAAERIRVTYPPAQERDDLLSAWDALLARRDEVRAARG
jgi:glycosyltransferase involved in cell wall biosynthesis